MYFKAQALNTAYYNTALNRPEIMVQSFTVFKLCAMLAHIVGVIIIIIIITFFGVRMKK